MAVFAAVKWAISNRTVWKHLFPIQNGTHFVFVIHSEKFPTVSKSVLMMCDLGVQKVLIRFPNLLSKFVKIIVIDACSTVFFLFLFLFFLD
uniref:Uncharacterized protein n=1 Tax=Canis lupus dingo TaxID=286419 RepID=A0A8C0QVJ2_CANLU